MGGVGRGCPTIFSLSLATYMKDMKKNQKCIFPHVLANILVKKNINIVLLFYQFFVQSHSCLKSNLLSKKQMAAESDGND